MKIFLAGATGAIGRALVPLLVNDGHEVVGTTRRADKRSMIEGLGGRPIVVDALDREGMFAALSDAHPAVVIHQLTDLSDRDFAANSRLRVEGTRNLVDAALKVGVQRMIAQSIAWMYVPGDKPAHEGEPLDLNAPSSRGQTVAAVQSLEQAVAEVDIGIILRYGLLYGPGTWYSRDGLTSQQVRHGEIVANDEVTSFLYVADAAQAARMALDWPSGTVNIVDDDPAAGTDWLPIYASLIGAPPPPFKAGAPGWARGASNAKARQLGWSPIYPTWREGFRAILA